MSTVRRVARNLFSLFSGEAVSSALGFVITILLARRLSDEGFGRLAFVQSLTAYIGLVMDMGLGTFGAREIARESGKLEEYLNNIISLRLVFAIAAAASFFVITAIYPMPKEMRWLCWASAVGLLTQALNPEFAFQGSERMSGIAAWRVLVHLFYLTLIIFIISGRSQLWIVPLLRFFAEALTLLLIGFWAFNRKSLKLMIRWQPRTWKKYLRASLFMAGSLAVIKLYYTVDTLLLGIIDKPEAVGWYQASYKVSLLFISASGLTQVAFAPLFSRNWDNPKRIEEITSQFGTLLTFLACSITFVLFVFHQPVINILYGADYYPAGAGLQILAINVFLVFIGTIFMASFQYINRQKEYFIIVCISTAVNLIANLILIPRYSLYGAAWSAILGSVTICILAIAVYSKTIGSHHTIRNTSIWSVVFLAGFTMMPVLIELPLLWWVILFGIFNILFLLIHWRALVRVYSSLASNLSNIVAR